MIVIIAVVIWLMHLQFYMFIFCLTRELGVVRAEMERMKNLEKSVVYLIIINYSRLNLIMRCSLNYVNNMIEPMWHRSENAFPCIINKAFFSSAFY